MKQEETNRKMKDRIKKEILSRYDLEEIVNTLIDLEQQKNEDKENSQFLEYEYLPDRYQVLDNLGFVKFDKGTDLVYKFDRWEHMFTQEYTHGFYFRFTDLGRSVLSPKGGKEDV